MSGPGLDLINYNIVFSAVGDRFFYSHDVYRAGRPRFSPYVFIHAPFVYVTHVYHNIE